MKLRGAGMLALLAFAASASAGDSSHVVDGLWIHHEKWDFAPAEFNEKGDIHKSASAAVVNFCPHGEFMMATGVIYQSTRSPAVMIGASDGLAIYAGRWSKAGDTISVEYRLVDAEIRRTPDDLKNPETHVAELTFAKGRLRFPFATRFGTIWQLKLLPAANYEKRVIPEFVECTPKPR